MKKTVSALCICLALVFLTASYMESTEAALADGVIRLHITANSDRAEDQQLKLKVRDRILSELGQKIINENEIDTVKAEIVTNLDFIKKMAEDEIRKNGYTYDAEVSFGNSSFPRKVYGSITLPAGEYRALKVNIGRSEGQNWWCVLFPPMCFIDEACVSVSKESNDILKEQLGESAYEMVSAAGTNVEFRLRSYEIWQKGKNLLETYIADFSN